MHSVIPAAHPTVPQADDVQAIQYYYGTGSTTPPPPAPTASFTFSPAAPAAGQTLSFHDASTGAPTSWVWGFGDGTSALTANPSHVYAAAGTYTVSLSVTNAGGTGTLSRSITIAAPPVGCGAGALCLNGNRFRVIAAWTVPSGASGVGIPVPLTGDTGYFWFFSSNNVELVVKVVDGRVVNGRFWVFSGALSDVQYTLTVTDTVTGAVRTYSNPQGTLASRADTAAFLPATAEPGP
jgi:PKD repeat protein